MRPRWIITCNFDEIRIYDQEKENPEDFTQLLLVDLPESIYQIGFFTDKN